MNLPYEANVVTCDAAKCYETSKVKTPGDIPKGWTLRGGRLYCPASERIHQESLDRKKQYEEARAARLALFRRGTA